MFPDLIAVLVAYLKHRVDATVVGDIPDGWDYTKPVVHVADMGGPGVFRHVLDQRRVSFYVTHPDRAKASRLTEHVRELIQDYQGGPWYWVSDTATVAYFPDGAVKKPRYVYTARINTKKV
ncbi:hypothetical protein GKZ75_08555 [Kocuria indica]|uniref:DUF3168 domain-containing protein n=1 Tax=Kocuria marina subsp. indica TaxID=1049583 RepID=A0A6N9QYE6_9MICC|nr:hypothetical protein [Kocuria indica]NDO78272.1 hypothetical protein [Kocuria indica]